MINLQENIWKDGEYNYEAAYGFTPNVYSYLHDDDKVRACMMIVPGGGYCMVCNVEGEPMAKVAYDAGMNVFVLTYTTDITMSVPLKMQPLNDISRAIRYIRANAERFHIDPTKLSICGSSAGGHLCASITTHFDDVKDIDSLYNQYSNRPDGTILCYPVITSGPKTHIYSMQALLGYEPAKEELEYFSCEKQVSENTPPCFIWQTVEDDAVPVENSMMFASALKEKNIPYAYYAFPHGGHGLSLNNAETRSGIFGGPYTFEQVDKAVEAVRLGKGINVSAQRKDELMIQFFGNVEGIKDENAEPVIYTHPFFEDVAMWPKLCEIWLKRMNLL